jgi:hypothetical protein
LRRISLSSAFMRGVLLFQSVARNRRRRAAHDAPPATLPTMVTFILFSCVILVVVLLCFELIWRIAQELPLRKAISNQNL